MLEFQKCRILNNMDFGIARLVLDFSLLVLILIVQLIIYPSFRYFQTKDLIKWHSSYTKRIGGIVMPLMTGQLVIGIVQVFQNSSSIYNVVYLFLVIGVWVSTFFQFVPMHSLISRNMVDTELINKLIVMNWLRTTLWLMIFLLSLFTYVY